ncbi:expressed unknown protein [Seminavis robusta]|uniref:Uncharacterized protein n=1 Tax=Seminavis robusta TaxID=568900 RepID=A0A9N8ELM9_9STRA|nr:expressed unknown protein [Seminavis robusta]|eukprot:Sro1185_g250230.1 n/a (406) ;mRNA; f:26322-27649
MAPRPRPEDGLFQASAEEKPYLHTGRRRSSLLSGWEEHEDTETLLSSSNSEMNFELTSCSGSQDDHGCDPLLGGSISDILAHDHHEQDTACDGAIAAMMSAEWNRQYRQKRKQQLEENNKNNADKPWTLRQQIACVMAGLLVAGLVLGLCVFSIQYGLGAGKKSHYVCPTTLDGILSASYNQTQLCGDEGILEEQCTCQDPTLPQPVDASILDAEQHAQQEAAALDVIFLGKLFDDDDNEPTSWMDDGLHSLEIGTQGEQSSTILYRFDQELMPAVPPKVWWITLDHHDTNNNNNDCSLDATQAGVVHVVQRILQASPTAQIILSPSSGTITPWNERLQCIASTTYNVEYMNPFVSSSQVEDEEDDDDFFVDVSSSTSSTSSILSREEAQQAVVLKLQELLHTIN